MSDINAKVMESITVLRESLQMDGGDLEVIGVNGPSANIRLTLTADACRECIMPQDVLKEMLLMNIQEKLPEITAVSLEDPRTA